VTASRLDISREPLWAWRQANGDRGLCEEARVALAVEIVQEAQRRALLERLDSVMEFLAVGATPDQAVARLECLIAEYRGGARRDLEAAA